MTLEVPVQLHILLMGVIAILSSCKRLLRLILHFETLHPFVKTLNK